MWLLRTSEVLGGAPGTHTIRVNVAGGSNIVAPFYPTVEAPVLSIHY